MKTNVESDVLQDILKRLTFLYLRIENDAHSPGAPKLDLPPLEVLSKKVAASSVMVFPDQAKYLKSVRASEYPTWSSDRVEGLGADVYRIFFNDYSQKFYVDLNGPRWKELRKKLDSERLYCEILKTLIFAMGAGEDKTVKVLRKPTPSIRSASAVVSSIVDDRTEISSPRIMTTSSEDVEEREEVPMVDISKFVISDDNEET